MIERSVNPISNQNNQYNVNDITLLRNSALVYFAVYILSILINLVIPSMLSILVIMGGTLIFAIGIFIFTNRYPRLNYGKIVAILLIIEVSFKTLTYFIDIQGSDSLIIISLVSSILISAGLVIITAYFFTKWFNTMLSEYNMKSNAYLYYGIMLLIGQIGQSFGIFSMGSAFITYYESETVSDAFIQEHSLSILVLYFSLFIIIIASYSLIIASYIIYSRINTILNAMKTPQISQRAIPTTIKTTKSITPLYSTFVHQEDFEGDQQEFCGNCGKKVAPGNSFCENCGIKIN